MEGRKATMAYGLVCCRHHVIILPPPRLPQSALPTCRPRRVLPTWRDRPGPGASALPMFKTSGYRQEVTMLSQEPARHPHLLCPSVRPSLSAQPTGLVSPPALGQSCCRVLHILWRPPDGQRAGHKCSSQLPPTNTHTCPLLICFCSHSSS